MSGLLNDLGRVLDRLAPGSQVSIVFGEVEFDHHASLFSLLILKLSIFSGSPILLHLHYFLDLSHQVEFLFQVHLNDCSLVEADL